LKNKFPLENSDRYVSKDDYRACNLSADKNYTPAPGVIHWEDFSRGHLILACNGYLTVVAEGTSTVLFPGSLIWVPKQYSYKTIGQPESVICNEFLNTMIRYFSSARIEVIQSSGLLVELIKKFTTIPVEALDNLVVTYTQLIIAEIKGSSGLKFSLPMPKDKRLLTLCDNLLRHPFSINSVEELINGIPLSYRHAVRLFKEQTGMNINRWWALLKLHVSTLFLSQGKAVTWVAHEIGYTNVAGYSSAFKKIYGVPPRSYVV